MEDKGMGGLFALALENALVGIFMLINMLFFVIVQVFHSFIDIFYNVRGRHPRGFYLQLAEKEPVCVHIFPPNIMHVSGRILS